MKFGRCKFYADENIEEDLIEFIREKGYKVISAKELGLSGKNDKYHLIYQNQERIDIYLRIEIIAQI